jgi:hypothetical protein
MTIKRFVLIFLSLLAIANVLFALIGSLNEPQAQGRLELYQTNLVLHTTEYRPAPEDVANFSQALESLVGKDPYLGAKQQYDRVIKDTEVNLSNLESELDRIVVAREDEAKSSNSFIISFGNSEERERELQKSLQETKDSLASLKIKTGILDAVRGQTQEAIATWESLNNTSQADLSRVLVALWKNSAVVKPDFAISIQENLNSWFRFAVLKKFYQRTENNNLLEPLLKQEQTTAYEAIIKLSIIAILPVLAGIIGIIISIVLLIQLFIKKDNALLNINKNLAWQVNWDWETTWQVLLVGFFIIGQFILPILWGLSGLKLTGLSLSFKALYILINYVLMAVAGLLVLYLSIKSFLPLQKDWFTFKVFDRWFLWGFGGYLVALPLVLIVSILNQQIWQGQGGSNPLLFLALQSQDKLALTIFFITASVAAPIFEEIMFRGFLLPSLTRYLPVWGAIIISGLVFAIAHLSLSEIVPLATLGIILGFVYTRSRNLLSSILLHSLWNSGTLISLFVLGSSIE